MTKEQIFTAWAPPGAIWSPWAKPVLFSHMRPGEEGEIPPVDQNLASRADGTTALVVDLPGATGVAAGLCLSSLGYRPVPLYNACPEAVGEPSIVEVRPILLALAGGALQLINLRLADDAPPVFLLDFNRRISRVPARPGLMDNRSISLPTDFPSANFLLSRGIRQVVLIHQKSIDEMSQMLPSIDFPQADLCHTLCRWQDAGLKILEREVNTATPPQSIVLKKPSSFKVFFYNLLATSGLRSSPLGGFGGKLPVPGGSAG